MRPVFFQAASFGFVWFFFFFSFLLCRVFAAALSSRVFPVSGKHSFPYFCRFVVVSIIFVVFVQELSLGLLLALRLADTIPVLTVCNCSDQSPPSSPI